LPNQSKIVTLNAWLTDDLSFMYQAPSIMDQMITHFDTALRSICIPAHRHTSRVSPAHALDEAPLTPTEKTSIARLLRVNHAGEVCAQALYQGQALTAKLTTTKEQMNQAAKEELDHLGWCEQRLRELNSHTSYLNPIWYASSFLLGAVAGLIGDEWSLGFVAETERQVTAHLAQHLAQLPHADRKTQAILAQMQYDEKLHANNAVAAGAKPLPEYIQLLMHYTAKLLTTTSQLI
jgi:ubiquinone biosynthesis monooxygenase Coq7